MKEQEPTTKSKTLVSLEVYNQVTEERNIAIQQLHELGYEFGQKIEPTTKNDLGVDCISRAYLYNRIYGIDHDEDYECDEFGGSKITYHTCDWDEVLREIEDAPSVAPQEPKTGYWISRWYAGHNFHFHVCSECNEEFSCDMETGISVDNYSYCPNCGAKMVEPQESEDT